MPDLLAQAATDVALLVIISGPTAWHCTAHKR